MTVSKADISYMAAADMVREVELDGGFWVAKLSDKVCPVDEVAFADGGKKAKLGVCVELVIGRCKAASSERPDVDSPWLDGSSARVVSDGLLAEAVSSRISSHVVTYEEQSDGYDETNSSSGSLSVAGPEWPDTTATPAHKHTKAKQRRELRTMVLHVGRHVQEGRERANGHAAGQPGNKRA